MESPLIVHHIGHAPVQKQPNGEHMHVQGFPTIISIGEGKGIGKGEGMGIVVGSVAL